MEEEPCHQTKKAMLEYVRSGERLSDSPSYLKMDVVANFLFFIYMHITAIVILAIFWSDLNSQWILLTKVFSPETVYLMSEMESNFFAESLLCTWWLHFQENIFTLGPKSASSFSCNTQQQTYLITFFYFSCYLLEKKDVVPNWQILYFISNWMSPEFKVAS